MYKNKLLQKKRKTTVAKILVASLCASLTLPCAIRVSADPGPSGGASGTAAAQTAAADPAPTSETPRLRMGAVPPARSNQPEAGTEATPATTQPEATPQPSAEATPEVTPEATPQPTPEPTPEATPEPTAQPTPEATPQPTAQPTPEATPQPTTQPAPTPAPEAVTPTPDTKPEATPGAADGTTPSAAPSKAPGAKPTATPSAKPSKVPKPTKIPAPTPTPKPTTEQTDQSRQVPIKLHVGSYSEPVLFSQIDKDYALSASLDTVNLYEDKRANSRVVGTLTGGGLCFIIADKDQDWVFVESGDVRGFVEKSRLIMDDAARLQIRAIGEDKFSLATLVVPTAENEAYTYSRDTVKKVNATSELRKSLLDYAGQFVGNPYVWGGTSLTNGCDCSGYVMQIYRAFGYSLPRTSPQQTQYGTQIPVEEAQPGDLIFYQKEDGSVFHVLLYTGDGKALNAKDESSGIVVSDVNYSLTACAVRVIAEDKQEMYAGSTEGFSTAPSGRYLGRFKLTAYCNCEICCGKWAGGPTASGAMPTQGTTIAVGGIDFGTKLNVGGQVLTVQDRGTPYGHIDIYMNDHEACRQFGVQYADVYVQE